jgi:sulfonate transport system permease protein
MTSTVKLLKLPLVSPKQKRGNTIIAPRNLVRVLVPLLILALWQLVSSAGIVSPRALPTPTTILEGFAELWEGGDLQAALPASLARAGWGLGVGIVIGIVAGVLNGLFRPFEELFDSTFQMVRLIPFIAAVPLLILWFGIGDLPKILLITLASLFPVYLNTYSGVRNVDIRLVEAGKVFGLSRLQLILQIVLPQAAPAILVGIRFAMGSSLLALIVAEQVNTNSGIGYIIFLAQSSMRIDLIVVAIIIYAILGIIVDIVMRLLEKLAMPWS